MLQGQLACVIVSGTDAIADSRFPLSSVARDRMLALPSAPGTHA